MKTSLHQSGKWREAFTDQHMAKPNALIQPPQDRAFSKWDRPGPFTPGVTRAYEVVAADPDLMSDREPTEDTGVVWIVCPLDCVVRFTVLLCTEQSPVGWPGRQSMRTVLVYEEALGNAEHLYVVARVSRLEHKMRKNLADQRLRAFVAASEQGIEVDTRSPQIRLVATGIEHGTGVALDLTMAAMADEPGSFSAPS